MVVDRTIVSCLAPFYKSYEIMFFIISLLVYCIWHVVPRCDMITCLDVEWAISRMRLIAFSLSVLCDRMSRTLDELVTMVVILMAIGYTCGRVCGYR